MQLQRLNKQGGFTLIEVLISVTLLTIGLLAIGGGEVTVVTSTKGTTERMKATAAGESMIELMRRNSDNLLAYDKRDTRIDQFGTSTTNMMRLDSIDWKAKIAEVRGARGRIALAQTVVPSIMTATVGVFWPNGPEITPANLLLFPGDTNGVVFTTNIESR